MNLNESNRPNQQVLRQELKNIENRITDYDWDYRLTRFEDKVSTELERANNLLKEIKLSD